MKIFLKNPFDETRQDIQVGQEKLIRPGHQLWHYKSKKIL